MLTMLPSIVDNWWLFYWPVLPNLNPLLRLDSHDDSTDRGGGTALSKLTDSCVSAIYFFTSILDIQQQIQSLCVSGQDVVQFLTYNPALCDLAHLGGQ